MYEVVREKNVPNEVGLEARKRLCEPRDSAVAALCDAVLDDVSPANSSDIDVHVVDEPGGAFAAPVVV